MKRRFLTMAFYLSLCSAVCAQDKGIAFIEDKPWKDLLAMAGTANKLIFLDCYTTWCGPCKAMAKDVFPLPEVGAFMNEHFINTKFDMEKGEGKELNAKYKQFIPGYPTYLLINAKGEVVHQVAGYNAAEKFIAKIKDGLEERTWIAYSNKYAAGQRDWPFIQSYLVLLENAFQSAIVKKVTTEVLPALTLDIISTDSSAYRVFRKYWTDTESPLLSTYLASPAIYRKYRDPEKDVNEWGGRLYKKAVDAYTKDNLGAPEKYDAAKAKKMIDELQKLSVGGRENLLALLSLSQAVATNNGKRFVELCNNAFQFGLLRYDKDLVSSWAKYMAGKTTDKAMLQQYLGCIQIPENSWYNGAEEMRNYAFVLERLGEKEKAKEYYAKADQKEAEIKAKFKSLSETNK